MKTSTVMSHKEKKRKETAWRLENATQPASASPSCRSLQRRLYVRAVRPQIAHRSRADGTDMWMWMRTRDAEAPKKARGRTGRLVRSVIVVGSLRARWASRSSADRRKHRQRRAAPLLLVALDRAPNTTAAAGRAGGEVKQDFLFGDPGMDSFLTIVHSQVLTAHVTRAYAKHL